MISNMKKECQSIKNYLIEWKSDYYKKSENTYCIITEQLFRSIWVQKNTRDLGDHGYLNAINALVYFAAANFLLTSSQFTTDQNALM